MTLRPKCVTPEAFVSFYAQKALLVGCLTRLRVIRPSSLFELLASIEVLRFELQYRPAVVAVDGMSSFFWQDKV